MKSLDRLTLRDLGDLDHVRTAALGLYRAADAARIEGDLPETDLDHLRQAAQGIAARVQRLARRRGNRRIERERRERIRRP